MLMKVIAEAPQTTPSDFVSGCGRRQIGALSAALSPPAQPGAWAGEKKLKMKASRQAEADADVPCHTPRGLLANIWS